MGQLKDFLTKEKWIKGAKAKTEEGKITSVDNEDATRFCLYGALCKVYPMDKYLVGPEVSKLSKLTNAIQEYKPMDRGSVVIDFNDNPETTWDDIAAVLRIAGI